MCTLIAVIGCLLRFFVGVIIGVTIMAILAASKEDKDDI